MVGFPSVSVVVPALNEERNIPYVFGRIPADVHQVVLVDGCSVDGTVAAARRLRPDVCVVQDCVSALEQGEYRPSRLLEAIVVSYPFSHRQHKP